MGILTLVIGSIFFAQPLIGNSDSDDYGQKLKQKAETLLSNASLYVLPGDLEAVRWATALAAL